MKIISNFDSHFWQENGLESINALPDLSQKWDSLPFIFFGARQKNGLLVQPPISLLNLEKLWTSYVEAPLSDRYEQTRLMNECATRSSPTPTPSGRPRRRSTRTATARVSFSGSISSTFAKIPFALQYYSEGQIAGSKVAWSRVLYNRFSQSRGEFTQPGAPTCRLSLHYFLRRENASLNE